MSAIVAAQSGTKVASGTSSAAAVENIGRREITICNDHATQILYVQLAVIGGVAPTAVVGQGIRLNAAGGSWTSNAWDGAVAVIATGGSSNYTIVEF